MSAQKENPNENRAASQSMTLRDFNPTKDPVVDEIKRRVDELDEYVRANVPENRCRAVGLTNLEQAAMWLVKANFAK